MKPVRTLVVAVAVSVVAILSLQTSAGAAPKPSAPLSLSPPAEDGERPSADAQGKVAKPARVVRRPPAQAPIETDQPIVLQGADSAALIAQLPWWRPDAWLAAREPDKVGSNQVLAVALAWIGPGAVAVAPTPGKPEPTTVAQAVPADPAADTRAAALADRRRLQEIDRRASDQSARNGLLVMFAGALAAITAACFLFAFRRRPVALTDSPRF